MLYRAVLLIAYRPDVTTSALISGNPFKYKHLYLLSVTCQKMTLVLFSFISINYVSKTRRFIQRYKWVTHPRINYFFSPYSTLGAILKIYLIKNCFQFSKYFYPKFLYTSLVTNDKHDSTFSPSQLNENLNQFQIKTQKIYYNLLDLFALAEKHLGLIIWNDYSFWILRSHKHL